MTTRPTLRVGSTGTDVIIVQTALSAVPIDGDFGSITEQAVKGFQFEEKLVADGVVGPQTWAALEETYNIPPPRPDKPLLPPLPPAIVGQIKNVVDGSEIAWYEWQDRGVAPIGYSNGMAIAFAYAALKLKAKDKAILEIAKANTGDEDHDVLAWYSDVFRDCGMDNSRLGVDTLRHLYSLLIGLGMRESSGEHCCGRDQSASNTDAMTCEAGLFQTSWNISGSSPNFDRLMSQYSEFPPQCYLDVFAEDVSCGESDWQCYGSGEGFDYQEMAKKCPVFAVEVTALGLRTLRQHWGPINRYEVELRPEADTMLRQVQALL